MSNVRKSAKEVAAEAKALAEKISNDNPLNFEKEAPEEPKKEKLKRQTYYMSQDLIDALALKGFTENKDKSRIVREALYEYVEKKYFKAKPIIEED